MECEKKRAGIKNYDNIPDLLSEKNPPHPGKGGEPLFLTSYRPVPNPARFF
ncbi:hypothetical protein SAMN03080602_00093 [Arenibacter troitsensis]|uniref:Uncharacterized protein n=1 Tax=Arenibacter troitsensis TaxID=188872 RepID=A0A1X7HXD9_9FLAO|nr:hypothetical protein SAMN03080602_00093 [Arenibacter troitsensis]